MHYYLIWIAIAICLAVLHELGSTWVSRYLYGPFVLLIAVFSGTRFEVGQDWEAYKEYFDIIQISSSPISAYFEHPEYQRFEIAYYLLNWSIKLLGFSYQTVLLVASLFCAYSVYRLTRRFPGNKLYILTAYLGFSFLLLHFAQVRQSIAIGFLALACDSYLSNRRRFLALLIGILGMFFQYSSVIYNLLLILALWWPKKSTTKIIYVLGLVVLFSAPFILDPWLLLRLLSVEGAQTKLQIYQDTRLPQGAGLKYQAFILSLIIAYLVINLKRLSLGASFIARYAMLLMSMTVVMVVVFPGLYVLYSRSFVAASLFQGFALSLVMEVRRNSVDRTIVFVATLMLALGFYLRLLILYQEEYVPYHSWLGWGAGG